MEKFSIAVEQTNHLILSWLDTPADSKSPAATVNLKNGADGEKSEKFLDLPVVNPGSGINSSSTKKTIGEFINAPLKKRILNSPATNSLRNGIIKDKALYLIDKNIRKDKTRDRKGSSRWNAQLQSYKSNSFSKSKSKSYESDSDDEEEGRGRGISNTKKKNSTSYFDQYSKSKSKKKNKKIKNKK